jgi:hypothetical protein
VFRTRSWVLVASFWALNCRALSVASPRQGEPLRYDVEALTSHDLKVTLHVTGAAAFRLPLAEALVSASVRTAGGTARTMIAPFLAPECEQACEIVYTLKLTHSQRRSVEVYWLQNATLADSSGFLMVPANETTPRPFTVTFSGSAASGLRDDARMTTADLVESGYTAFGAFDRSRLTRGQRSVDVVVLGDTVHSANASEVVTETLNAMDPLWRGGLPVPHLSIFMVPAGDANDAPEFYFGEVRAFTGASLLVLGSSRAFHEEAKRVAKQEWVLVHELVHVGFPTLPDDARWLTEGLATYYEPLIRARTGWQTEEALFAHFATELKRGDGAILPDQAGINGVYWGGALFCMHVDLAIRRQSSGKRSLDDVMRTLASEGHSTETRLSVSELARLADRSTGTQAFSRALDAHVTHRTPVRSAELVSALEAPMRTGALRALLHW